MTETQSISIEFGAQYTQSVSADLDAAVGDILVYYDSPTSEDSEQFRIRVRLRAATRNANRRLRDLQTRIEELMRENDELRRPS